MTIIVNYVIFDMIVNIIKNPQISPHLFEKLVIYPKIKEKFDRINCKRRRMKKNTSSSDTGKKGDAAPEKSGSHGPGSLCCVYVILRYYTLLYSIFASPALTSSSFTLCSYDAFNTSGAYIYMWKRSATCPL